MDLSKTLGLRGGDWKASWFGRALSVALGILLLWLFWRFGHRGLLRTLLVEVRDMGPWAPVGYIGLYMAACVLMFPGSIMGFAGGACFGVWPGLLYASIGCALGASAAFLVGRYLARDWVGRKLAGYGLFQAVQEAVAAEGWRIVGLTRLSLLMPFNLLNYVFGVSRVSFREYLFATWIGMLPETGLQVYSGALAGDLTRHGLLRHPRSPLSWFIFAAGLLTTVALAVYIARLAGRALKRSIPPILQPRTPRCPGSS